MAVNTASGTRVYIGGTTPCATLAAYQALTWVEVGEVEDAGEFGDESSAVTWTALKDGRTRKMKGPRDAGTLALAVGDDPNDVGQIALAAAEQSPLAYNFKVVLSDKITTAGNNSEHYFNGPVMSRRKNVGGVSNVVKGRYSVGVNTSILETLPT